MTASEEEIIAFCREHLAKYKVPTSTEFRKELPVSALGKVLRRDLVNK
jgi:long-chain acyl-CoA synthetase